LGSLRATLWLLREKTSVDPFGCSTFRSCAAMGALCGAPLPPSSQNSNRPPGLMQMLSGE